MQEVECRVLCFRVHRSGGLGVGSGVWSLGGEVSGAWVEGSTV